MNSEISHEIRTKITSLSTKLKCLKNIPYRQNNNIAEIFIEKVKFSLPLLIAEIIRNLEFTDQSKDKFITLINDYNKENNTKLDFDNFDSICWIRINHNEIQIPAVVKHFLYALNNDFDKEIENIPEERKDVSLCLLHYYNSILNKRSIITEKKLNHIINNLNINNDVFNFLIEKNILEFDKTNKVYLWGTNEHYPKILNDEIAALLWILEKNESNLKLSFFRYYNLLRKTHIELNILSDYLPANDCHILFLQSIEYLKNETDLKNSDKETKKIWYDSDAFSHQNIFENNIPILSFFEIDTYSLLKHIKNQDSFWRLENIINMQKTRMSYYSLLRYIILYELDNSFSFGENIIEIIKDVSRPNLIFDTLFLIERSYPEIISWFLVHLDLSPIAMSIIQKFEVNSNYFANDVGLYNKDEKQHSMKNELWIESFDIVLVNIIENWNNINVDKQQLGKTIALIFLDLSKRIYNFYPDNNPDIIYRFHGLLNTYSESLKRLQNMKTNHSHFYNYQAVKQSLFPLIFQYTIKYIIDFVCKLKIFDRNSIIFHFEYFDVTIDFIRTVNNLYNIERVTDNLKQQNEIFEKEIISLLFKNLCLYLNFEDIINKEKFDKYWFGFNIDKLDYIDWGYFFILLYKYDYLLKLFNKFKTSIKVDVSGNKYTDTNHNQIGKVRMFLRIGFLAYLSLKNIRTDIYVSNVKIGHICDLLEEFIIKYTVFYSVDNFEIKAFDAFDDFPSFAEEKKEKSLLELLFDSLNYMTVNKQSELIKNFFHNSINLERMLIAINIINDTNIKNIINNYIENINIENFVNSCFMITNIEEAVFQALYSDQHWEIAESLISRIKEHYAKRKIKDNQVFYLLYQANLLLALRKKNLNEIQSVEFQSEVYSTREYKITELKQFYIAIHMIDNEKNYTKAINILQDLLSNDEFNTNYEITLFRASIFEALNKFDIELINISYANWINFLKNLAEKKETIISRNREDIDFLSIPYFIANKKIIEFDNAIAHLQEEHKFHELLIKPICEFYFARNLFQISYTYLNNVNNYYKKYNKKTPDYVMDILSNPDSGYLDKLKQSYQNIITIDYKHIPIIVPDNINNKKDLNYFILAEIILSLKQLLIKIQTINQLDFEDNYTDIMQSILKLRFPFYGWSISDHSHYGFSERGISSGEPDLVIESSSNTITIIEALILKGKNKSEVHKHIKKCFSYSNFLERYYLLIYYKGKKENFDKTWEKYKNDFKSYNFSKENNMSEQFINLDEKFDNIRNIRIAKTEHTRFEMFHVMVNFSKELR